MFLIYSTINNVSFSTTLVLSTRITYIHVRTINRTHTYIHTYMKARQHPLRN